MANSDKTEQATPRRRQKAREQGQIARSRELMSSVAIGASVLTLSMAAPGFLPLWRGLLRHALDAAVTSDLATSGRLLAWTGSTVLRAVALMLVLSWMAATTAALAQGGLVFAGSALQPNFSRLNPANRLQQLFSLPSLGRLLKSLFPGTIIACTAGAVLAREWPAIIHLCRASVAAMVAYSLQPLFEICWKCALVLLVWSGADYFIEKRKFEGDLRMSRQDLKDEHKETEGHPAVKARIRRLRRQVARRRMLAEVKRAAVVITNPNEFAVALEYSPEMPAPRVVAKGRNLVAQQIKQIARWHGIPLVENPPLAHALYRAVEVGQSIPPKLYAVVAAILAAIYRAQERASRTTRKAAV
jgi:flagellar biosynthesis protein FlhB